MVLMLPMAQVDNRLEVYTLANWGSTLLMYWLTSHGPQWCWFHPLCWEVSHFNFSTGMDVSPNFFISKAIGQPTWPITKWVAVRVLKSTTNCHWSPFM
jgi:hypothetical protein